MRAILMPFCLAALLTACADSDRPTDPAPSTTTATTRTESRVDAAFARAMFAHHRQTIELADLALNAAYSTLETRELATANKRVAIDESARITTWLEEWGIDPPTHSAGALGMLSEQQMLTVRRADASRFNQLWMHAMLVHDRGAVAMARQLMVSTNRTELMLMARQIHNYRQQEIRMLTILLANAAVNQG